MTEKNVLERRDLRFLHFLAVKLHMYSWHRLFDPEKRKLKCFTVDVINGHAALPEASGSWHSNTGSTTVKKLSE